MHDKRMQYDGNDAWRPAGSPKDSPPSLGGTFGGLGKISQSARRTVVGGEGSEGSTTTRPIEYLDYCREQQDDDGNAYQQWALVEHNPDTHDMITLFGWSITPDSVERVGVE